MNFVRNSYLGGVTMVSNMKCPLNSPGISIDIKSSYPAAMTLPMPSIELSSYPLLYQNELLIDYNLYEVDKFIFPDDCADPNIQVKIFIESLSFAPNE